MSRLIDIITPLEKDVLRIRTMRGTEEMSRLFTYELTLLSDDGEVNFDELLGKSVTVILEKADESVRHFNGLVNRISQGSKEGRYHAYYATVRPWLWFLTRTKNYRIFQEKPVPDVLKEIFALHPIADVKFELTETYTPWTYCVQYNESDFDFVSRLMEHEGIYYYFTHEEGRHTLVIADSYSAHGKCYEEEIRYLPEEQRVRPEEEHVSTWSIARELRSGKYALSSYDFEKPSVDLQVKSTIPREHALADFEVFEYGGDYIERGDGETYVRARIEEEQAKFERVQAVTNARAMAPGFLFSLCLHPRADQNAEYLVISATYDIKSVDHEARDDAASSYSCSFTALNAKYPFRAERLTEKPIVKGPQTAVVVGPSGEDIYTDKFGRVKVHFYWDRYSKRDDKSSCWIRVSQNWGGKGWGGMFIPHVGQEVIVMFEGGDPDLPIISGRLYNAENMPPVALPGGKTQSVIRDHGGNEIIMEGAAGGQKMRLFSPTHNTSMVLGNSITLFTESDCKETTGGNREETTTGDCKETVRGKLTVKAGGDVLEFFGGLKHDTVVGSRTELTLINKVEATVGAASEVILGIKINARKGPEKNFWTSGEDAKTPTLRELIKDHNATIQKEKLTMAEKAEKVAGTLRQDAAKLLTKAQQLNNSAKTMKQVADAQMMLQAGAMKSKSAGKMELMAAELKQQASQIKLSGVVKLG